MTEQFTFNISLSVLNHLGRSLYRSFATVLGEAISNAWDADAQNVWIYIAPDKKGFFIKDDGIGMSAGDFQNKFLKIGYSKRKMGQQKSSGGRPFIGRKGIGKLALLSCAQKISIISKKAGADYISGVIDNSGLDDAITEDILPQDYPLGECDAKIFNDYTKDHAHGTIIYFEEISDGIKNSLDFLQKIIALYFRFSLLDESFNIYLNDEKITHKNLNKLMKDTQFLWEIENNNDPFINEIKEIFSQTPKEHRNKTIKFPNVKGFIASVKLPSHLNIKGMGERVGIDLFVNGRLRERNLLKHIPTTRIVESYLYGQIHFDNLDDAEIDRFTSSREGIVADDEEFSEFLSEFRKKLRTIIDDWDKWRDAVNQDGDPENKRLTPNQRASRGLFHVTSKDYKSSDKNGKVDDWIDELKEDASFNFESYADCFIAENLIRKYIKEKNISFSAEAEKEIKQYKSREKQNKQAANLSIEIREGGDDSSYLDMDALANLVDKPSDTLIIDATLSRDARWHLKPIRDAVAHTARLTDDAKKMLTALRENIKARIKTLLKRSLGFITSCQTDIYRRKVGCGGRI